MKWEAEERRSGPGGRKGHGCLKAIAVIAAIILVAGIVRCGSTSSAAKELDWPTTGIATVLPEPSSKHGEVNINNDSMFSADVEDYEQSDYEEYVEACQDRGFTIDEQSDSWSFEAYSSEGYRVNLSYFESSNEMTVDLYAPIEMGDITWPTEGPGALVPAPTSLTGAVVSDSSTLYTVKIGSTSPEDYASYVEACMAAGFNIDYNRGDDTFSADNADGAHVSIDYEGFNTMSISVRAPEETTSSDAGEITDASGESEGQGTGTTTTDTTDTSSSSFREAMDEYEAFIDEYVDFMLSYQNSGNTVELLSQYADWMAKYAEMSAKMDAIDEDSLTADDVAYYLEVMARVTERLGEL